MHIEAFKRSAGLGCTYLNTFGKESLLGSTCIKRLTVITTVVQCNYSTSYPNYDSGVVGNYWYNHVVIISVITIIICPVGSLLCPLPRTILIFLHRSSGLLWFSAIRSSLGPSTYL